MSQAQWRTGSLLPPTWPATLPSGRPGRPCAPQASQRMTAHCAAGARALFLAAEFSGRRWAASQVDKDHPWGPFPWAFFLPLPLVCPTPAEKWTLGAGYVPALPLGPSRVRGQLPLDTVTCSGDLAGASEGQQSVLSASAPPESLDLCLPSFTAISRLTDFLFF